METTKYTGKGVIVKCKSYNNGEPLFFGKEYLNQTLFLDLKKEYSI